MPSTTLPSILLVLALGLPLVAFTGAGAEDLSLGVGEYVLPDDVTCELRERWGQQLVEKYGTGVWAPMRMELSDEDLALMGLPARAWLQDHEFPEPTAIHPDGSTTNVVLPAVASYAGAGCFGIRPGAFLLLINDNSIGWCSMAHVYGTPGDYAISTAGHCGSTGDRATVIAAFSDTGIPILLDFGKFSKSTGDAGIGRDWALIDVEPRFQHLVSPTMCFWGGPLGMYTKTGATVAFTYNRRDLLPAVSADPDPFLAQAIVHYGHGTGLGTLVGTPRVGEAIYWGDTHFTFFGAISPGDSGSGSNTLGGDAVGQINEAAGINTHIYVDGIQPFKTGTGYLAGTRATLVSATLANGQIVPYPAPVPGAP